MDQGMDRSQSCDFLKLLDTVSPTYDDDGLNLEVMEDDFPFDAMSHFTEKDVNLPTEAEATSLSQDESVNVVLLGKESSRNNKRSATLISDDIGAFFNAAVLEQETKQEEGDLDISTASLSTFMSTDATATDEDLVEHLELLRDATTNGRIPSTKALQYQEVLQPGTSWKDMTLKLLRVSIPQKRTKKSVEGEDEPVIGYKCRICVVPLKGHVCPYCEVCSSPESKYKKDEDGSVHVCFNCRTCYDENKKKKKLRQFKIGKCECNRKSCCD